MGTKYLSWHACVEKEKGSEFPLSLADHRRLLQSSSMDRNTGNLAGHQKEEELISNVWPMAPTTIH